MIYVLLYLGAVVLANLTVTYFGPASAIVVAFPWAIILGQFLAKTLGGFLWSLILRRLDHVAFMATE